MAWALVGDWRPYVSVLILLDGEFAPELARQNGIRYSGLAEFSREPRGITEVERAVGPPGRFPTWSEVSGQGSAPGLNP